VQNQTQDRDRQSDDDTGKDCVAQPPATSLPDAVWFILVGLVALIPGLVTQLMGGIHSASLWIALTGTVFVGAVAALTVLLMYFVLLRRDLRRSLAVAAALVLVCFTWNYWTLTGAVIAELVGIAAARDIAAVAVPVAIVWIAGRFGDRDWFAVAATGIVIGVILIIASAVAPKLVRAPGPPVAVANATFHPNTILLILDGYARGDVLVDDFDHEGRLLADELENRGFVVQEEAVTNYSITYASLASMMAMDYPFDEGSRGDEELAEMRALLSGVGPLVGGFREAGYTVVKSENAWGGSVCSSWVDECYRSGVIRTSLWAIGQLTPFAPIQRSFFGHPFTSVGLQQIRELPERIGGDPESPRMVISHVTVPHAPTQLDAACQMDPQRGGAGLHLVSPEDSEAMVDQARARYASQVECVDREVLASIDTLLEKDPDLAILIVADHGPDSRGQLELNHDQWSDAAMVERMSVLSAMRLPEWCDQDGPAVTTVNTIRKLASCSLGTDLEPLPERMFWAPREDDGTLPVIDISDRLRSILRKTGR